MAGGNLSCIARETWYIDSDLLFIERSSSGQDGGYAYFKLSLNYLQDFPVRNQRALHISLGYVPLAAGEARAGALAGGGSEAVGAGSAGDDAGRGVPSEALLLIAFRSQPRELRQALLEGPELQS